MTLANGATAELKCFESSCGARYAITEVFYNCPKWWRASAGSQAISGLKRIPAAELKKNLPPTPHGQHAARTKRHPALPPRALPILGRLFPRHYVERGQHASARFRNRRGVRRLEERHLQAPGLQSDRFVQRQRHDRRSRPSAPPQDAPSRLCLHRQHLRVDGRLRSRGRARSADLLAARQHRVQQARASARVRREDS